LCRDGRVLSTRNIGEDTIAGTRPPASLPVHDGMLSMAITNHTSRSRSITASLLRYLK
jgi:hypothetical protein